MNDRTFGSVATGVDAQQTRHSDHEAFVNHRLARAQDALNDIGIVLEALASRLDTAISGEEVDATPAVFRVGELIWSYNNAVECARDDWLRHDLSPDLNERLLVLDTPTIFGLPWFLDEAQERRAMLQGVEISRRLNCRNELLDRVMAAANVVPLSTHVAGVGLGGGSYIEIRRCDDRWTLVKTVANASTPANKDKPRPCDAKLAAALVRFMLRKQFNSTQSID